MRNKRKGHFSGAVLLAGIIISFIYALTTDLSALSEKDKQEKESCIVYKHAKDYKSFVDNKCWIYTDFSEEKKVEKQ